MSMTREEAVRTLEMMAIDIREELAALNIEIPMAGLFRKRLEAVNTAQEALRPVSREQVSEFKTCDLVDELKKREGVETHTAEPYQDVTVSVNGPAVVLVVTD